MKAKTARRVMSRNAVRIARDNIRIEPMKPLLARRVRLATATLVKEAT